MCIEIINLIKENIYSMWIWNLCIHNIKYV